MRDDLFMSSQTSVHEIKTLVQSYHSLIAIENADEEYVKQIFMSVAQELSLTLFSWTSVQGFFSNSSGPLQISKSEDPLKAIQAIRDFPRESLFLLKDFMPHLQTATQIRLFRETIHKLQNSKSTVILLSPEIQLPQELQHLAVFPEIHQPSAEQIRQLVTSILKHLHSQSERPLQVDMNLLEGQDLIHALSGLTLKQIRQTIAHCVLQDGKLDSSDLQKIQTRKAEMLKESGLLDFYPPSLLSSDIGGFSRLKKYLETAKLGFSPEARKMNLPVPKGVLFVGVPGCGKSLCAKFIARTWNLPLLKLDAGRLFDKFIGESEKNFRKAILSSESMAPSILWIDEIEKAMGGSDGGSSSDSGLGKRIFGQFLTWLQEKTKSVFVVATANDLSLLPPEMLRKGRFDEVFFVDLPNTEERKEIFSIHLKLKKQSTSNLDLGQLSEATEGFSGAEIEQLVVSSLLKTLRNKSSLLTTELLLEEAKESIPLSVSRGDEISALRHKGKTQFLPVN